MSSPALSLPKVLGSAEFQDEAQKKTLDVDLLPSEELQALAKEVVMQPPEIIGQIRKLMGESQSQRPSTKLAQAIICFSTSPSS